MEGEGIIDAVVKDTPTFIHTSAYNRTLAGSIVINNAKLHNVDTAVKAGDGVVVLDGGSKTIKSWGQGNVYKGIIPVGKFTQGNIHAPHKPSMLLDDFGRIFGKTHPQYADYSVSQFVSVRDHGATGDGKTDDTEALKAIFQKVCRLPSAGAG